MLLFIMGNSGQPDPNPIARESREFARQTVARTLDRKESADRWLADAQGKFDDSIYSDARSLAEAEEKAEAADEIHTHALRKLDWEIKNRWNTTIPLKPGAMPTPWLTDVKAWLTIFKNRLRNPKP